MTRQCPFCEASITDEQLASVPMPVCPECKSSLPVEFWSADVRGSASPGRSPIEDEISVDFSADDSNSEAGNDRDEISELSVDWLDEVTVESTPENTDDLATVLPARLRNEFNLNDGDESFEKLFELDPTDGAEERDGSKPTNDEYALSIEPMAVTTELEDPSIATFDAVNPKAIESAPAVQPFEMKNGLAEGSDRRKQKKGIVARIFNGLAIVAGLIVTLCLLQLLCWWLLRMDPLQVALMLPKSVQWLTPYSLTEDGQRVAMQTKIRPTTSGEPLTDDDLRRTGVLTDGPESQADDVAVEGDRADDTVENQTEVPANEPPAAMDDTTLAQAPADPADEIAADSGEIVENPLEGDSTGSSIELEPADSSLPAAEVPTNVDPKANAIVDSPTAEPVPDQAESTNDSMDDLLDDLDSFAADSESEAPPPPENDGLAESPPAPAQPLITNVPVYQVADVRMALAAAERATDELNDAKRRQVELAELTQTAREFYSSLCQLAEAATLVDSGVPASELADVQSLLANLAQDAKKMRMIGTTASGWISRKLGNGVVVAGTIEAINPIGRFQEVSLRPIGSDQTMVIVTAEPNSATQELLSTGRNVLLAGYVLRDPESQLPNFLGTEPTVVWLHNVVVEVP